MEKLNRDETKFKSAIKQCVTEQGKWLMMKVEWYTPTLLIVLGKSKHHKDNEAFSIPFSIHWGLESKALAKEHLSSIVKAVGKKFTLRNTKITEYIFEFEKEDKLYFIRTDWTEFKMKESTGKYTY